MKIFLSALAEGYEGPGMPEISIETAELAPQIWCIRLKGEVDSSNLARLKSAFDQIFAHKV